MDDAVVRRATLDDIAALAELRRAFTFEDRAATASGRTDFDETFARVVGDGIASGRWVVAVAVADGRIVSHAFLGIVEKIPRPIRTASRIAYLTNVYTRPELRSRGIGARVVVWLQEWARANDVELFVVWPSDESVAFYRRLGFQPPALAHVWETGVGD